jgi:outer membrane cobalamin receptor
MLVLALLLASAGPPPPDDDDDRPASAVAATPQQTADDHEEEARVQPNNSIVITAGRLDTARTKIDAALGASVYSVTNETIERRPGGETGSLADILTQAPGVSLSGNRLAVRGSPATQLRINDVIIAEAISDPADLLSSRLAETTRLLTGTLPAQYGFAPGGVISITTKNGLYQHGGQAELFGGTDGMLEPAFEWADSEAATSLFASGDFERDRSSVADLGGIRTYDRRSAIQGFAFADHLIDGSDRVSMIFGGSDSHHKFGATFIGPGREDGDDAYVIGTFQHSNGGFTIQSSLSGGLQSDRMQFSNRSQERRSSLGVQVDASDQTSATHTLRFGILASRASVDEHALGGSQVHAARGAVALYAAEEWQAAPSLTFDPGVRVEWLQGLESGATIEPRASLVWQSLRGTAVHIGYGRYASAAPVGEASPAANLADEHDDIFDAGMQQQLGGFTIAADAYSRSAQNYVAEHQTIGSASPMAFEYKHAQLKGLELAATYSHGPLAAWANLALAKARGKRIVGGETLFSPEVLAAASTRWVPLDSDRPVTASAGVTWRLGKVSLSGDILASSGAVRTKMPADPNGSRRSVYAVLGLAAVYHARIAHKPADLRIDLINLTNRHYVTSDATALEAGWTRWGEGRAVTVGIEQGF